MNEDTRRETSFDPRAWRRGGTGDRPAPPPVPAVRDGGPPIAALCGSAAILALGALLALTSRAPADVSRDDVAATVTAAGAPRAERRLLTLSGVPDLEPALVTSGVDPAAARAAAAAALPSLRAGGEIRAAMTLLPNGGRVTLTRLEVSNADSSGVIVERAGTGYAASPVAADLTARVVDRRGTMDADSFYSSAVAAGVIDSLIPDFAAALAFDFDFQREVRKGDGFEAAFEQRVDRDGRPVGPPTLLYAALSTKAKSAAVYRFAPPGGQPGWFDAQGRSVKRALLRTPVDAARVSSGFGFRLHPILGFMKLHKGTDFAAPIGTPIFASGDATVEFAGPKGPNGNFVKLRHTNGWESLYLHMSEFGPGVSEGAHVAQGQEIGKVGTTGRSTGPHLHYELHISGAPVDPMSVQTETAPPLSGAALAAFKRDKDRIDVSRAGSSG